MKILLSLPFVFFPFIAIAESTNGYSYGDDSVVAVGLIAVVIVIAFFMFRRRK